MMRAYPAGLLALALACAATTEAAPLEAARGGLGCNAVPAESLGTRRSSRGQVVCACSEALGCDAVEPEGAIGADTVVVYESRAAGEGTSASHLARSEHAFSSGSEHAEREMRIGCGRRQHIRGFGGAFTDSSAAHFGAMSAPVREQFVASYWGGGADASSGAPAASAGGIGYTLGRVVLGSSDFSTGPWSYDDSEGDLALSRFSLERDEASGKLPMVRAALGKRAQPTAAAGGGTRGRPAAALSIYGAVWAPPAWMTAANSTVHCTLRGGYRPGATVAAAFARYIRRALDEYAAAGAPLFGATAGNEPNYLGQTWQQLAMSAAEQREWIAYHLGPALKPRRERQLAAARNLSAPAAAAEPQAGNVDYELIMLDDQRPFIRPWAEAVLNPGRGAAEAAPYVDGIGFHWCVRGAARLPFHLGRSGPFSSSAHAIVPLSLPRYLAIEDTLIVHPGRMLATAHARFPSKYLLATEACEGFVPTHRGPEAGSWRRALNYGYDIIEDTSNWAVGWTDWNLVLDLQGGPNWRCARPLCRVAVRPHR